ncbi:hypothetical protein ACJDU8_19580 [Clostridium sp. WILCCON 0269]|uniref:Uncharacterized protein n=1 Tax=Candidatus Clostridium eludens TaxID=3381663 RepID=A0ABW8SP81_9CLOT
MLEAILKDLKFNPTDILNINITDELENIIKNKTDAKVYGLKSPDGRRNQCQNPLAQQTIQFQSQIAQQQATISIVQTQNAELQQRINTIQNTVQTGQDTNIQLVQ